MEVEERARALHELLDVTRRLIESLAFAPNAADMHDTLGLVTRAACVRQHEALAFMADSCERDRGSCAAGLSA